MAYGLRISNPSGEIVVWSEGKLLSYLGKATWSSTSQPTTTVGGTVTFTFTYSGQIVPALKMRTDRRGAIQKVTQSGSTWTIQIIWWDTSGTPTAEGFHSMVTDADIYVFGFPSSAASSYGLQLFDSSGSLSADFTRRPLIIKDRAHFNSGSSTVTLSGTASVPALIGRTFDRRLRSITVNATLSDFLWDCSTYGLSSGNLIRTYDLRKRTQTNTSAFSADDQIAASDVWIIEATGLT